ncbi:MAG: hypothetical protein WBV67_17425 [Candidatus Cybelea sp.]|jgi:hypothetical protein
MRTSRHFFLLKFQLLGIFLWVVVFAAGSAPGQSSSDPRAANLINQSGAALHVAALRSIRIIHAKGNIVASGLSGSSDNWNEVGGMREVSRFSTPPLGGGSGWDGKESWTLDQSGLVIVDGSVLGRSSAVSQAYFSNYDLWTPGYGGAIVAWGGSKSEKGKSYDVLTVTPPKSSLPMDVYFDRATHLPVKVVQTAGPMVTTVAVTDFKPIDGLMIPYRVDTSTNTGNSTSFTATSVEVNPSGGVAHLAAPESSPHDFSITNARHGLPSLSRLRRITCISTSCSTGRGRSTSLSTPAERTSSIRQLPRSSAWPAVDRPRLPAWVVRAQPRVSQ